MRAELQNVDLRVAKIESTLQQVANVLVLSARQDERLMRSKGGSIASSSLRHIGKWAANCVLMICATLLFRNAESRSALAPALSSGRESIGLCCEGLVAKFMP